MRVNSIIKY